MHKLYLDILFSLEIDSSEQIIKYIRISKNLQTNIQIYLLVQKSTNEYPNIIVLGKWHKCEYK